jgi:superfamily I DNA/RNA helicase
MTRFTDDWFKHGVDSREIAYLAFTKSAANEAASRIIGEQEGYDEEMAQRFPFFRTIHSLAYRGLTRDFPDMRLMTTADMKRFSQWSSLDGTFLFDKWEDLASVYQRLQGGGKTEWDDCLRAYTISRISCRSADDVERARTQIAKKAFKAVGMVDQSAYQVFVSKYETYKNDHGLDDFTDMLVHGLTKMKPIEDVKKVVIDEAQDLSPICVALCDRLFQNAEECYWAGDEDQAIYIFSGADARLFIDRYNRSDSQIHLQQTHRFGQDVWNQAEKVI